MTSTITSGKTNGSAGFSVKLLLWLAFLEGASVMAVEMVAAKMLAPLYGDSLYVWSTVIGVAFASMTIGYFSGGRIADKPGSLNRLCWVLLIAASSILFIPSIADALMATLAGNDVIVDIILISACSMFFPLFLLGMTPPLIIKNMAETTTEAGRKAGNVFFISTAGGILTAFAMGFAIIPAFGLTMPLLMVAIMLGTIPLVLLLRWKKWLSLIFFIALLVSGSQQLSGGKPGSKRIKVQYYTEGILGQVMVCDFFQKGASAGQEFDRRTLYVNRMPQTIIDRSAAAAGHLNYINYFSALTAILPENSRALILGLGGGTFVERFDALKFKIDICEIDQSVVEAAKRFFIPADIWDRVRVNIDDARHFMRKASQAYDLIAIDVFKGETPPHQVFTIESFQVMQQKLSPQGIILINVVKDPEGEIGRAARSIIRTIVAAGLELSVFSLPESGNIILMAGHSKADWRKIPSTYLGKLPEPDLDKLLIPTERIPLTGSPLLVDDKPILEILNKAEANFARSWYAKNEIREFSRYHIPIFH